MTTRDPNLPSEIEPALPVEPDPAPRADQLVCENCACRLTPTGQVFRMSARARAWLRSDETIDQLTAERNDANERAEATARELAAARAEIEKLRTPEAKKGFWNR